VCEQTYVIAYAGVSTATHNGGVGARVRALREGMDLSLRDLAERSGVSAPMLSQVERGETSPTLTVAERIASGLDLTLSQLLRLDEAPHVVVIRADERRARTRRGHRTDELTPPLPGQRADVSVHTLEPGASTGREGDPPLHEPGARETAVVLAGSVALLIDDERHDLSEGDSVTFDADLPHHFSNEGGRPAEFLAVVAAGLRRG
jgi:transcriptional regulator with XRE-family HTH domain